MSATPPRKVIPFPRARARAKPPSEETDREWADMPEEVVRAKLAEYGFDYDEVAASGLAFLDNLLHKDKRP